jgi:predicted ribosomally synthesized peptide with nif11-like leader
LEINTSLEAAKQFITQASQEGEIRKALQAAVGNMTGIEGSRAAQGIAKSHGFEASAEEIEQARLLLTGQLSDQDLEGVSGGKCSSDNTFKPVYEAGKAVYDVFTSKW